MLPCNRYGLNQRNVLFPDTLLFNMLLLMLKLIIFIFINYYD